MAQPESIELRPANKGVSNVEVSIKPEDGGSEVYNQTRTRRVFSFSQLFAFSLTYMALWEGMCT